MKSIVQILIIAISSIMADAQNHVPLDTIYANDTKTVALFFPEPIRQGITGSENFVFSYNRDAEQYFGLLQATPGKESNLLVINRSGAIFSYIVRYKEHLTKLNYFVSISESIGNEKPHETLESDNEEKVFDNFKVNYYQEFCTYLLGQKQRLGFIMEKDNRIVLSMENLVFDREELYVVIKIENRSSLDYDLNYLNLYISTRKKGKKKSLQSLIKEPLYIHNLPERISKDGISRIVVVLPKFSISNERVVILELDEKNGERNVKLRIPHKIINNPN